MSPLTDKSEAGRIAATLRTRAPHTWSHSIRVMRYALVLGQELKMTRPQLLDLALASLLHDVGKLALPYAVHRKPGPLTAVERELMQQHSQEGWRRLRHIPGLEGVAHVVLYHHERPDGHGYPAGLRGDEIPLGSRIIAVADAIDAMRSDRPYRHRLSFDETIRELRDGAGRQFDHLVVRRCLERVVLPINAGRSGVCRRHGG